MLITLKISLNEVISKTSSSEKVTEKEGPWIKGRGAKIIIEGVEVGQIGEIDPNVSFKFGLRVPIQAGEFDVDALGQLIADPVH